MADVEDEAPLSVLDLPQLHSKPSAAILLSTLSQLAIRPSSFNGAQEHSSLNIDESGLTGYLTRFVASPLAWIASDKEKEEVWEAASQRLSERSGRMAMSSISRTFSICDLAMRKDGTAPRYISIQLNEPSLTEDKVGHKTWTGSFLLAKRLPHTMAKHFPTLVVPPTAECLPPARSKALESPKPTSHLSPRSRTETLSLLSPPPSPTTLSPLRSWAVPVPPPIDSTSTPVTVLELGAGTGLTGLAAAVLFTNISVRLTDLPSIVPNLVANVNLNSHLFSNPPSTAILDWSKLPPQVDSLEQYDCILAADSLYDPRHPRWLTDAMSLFLKRQREARVVVELPFRDMDLPYHKLLREEMAKKGFVLLEEGEESGWDDWEGAWCEKMIVMCWWSVWGWGERKIEQMLKGKETGNESGQEMTDQGLDEGTGEQGSDDDDVDGSVPNEHETRQQRQQQRQPFVSEQRSDEKAVAMTANLHENEVATRYTTDDILDKVRSTHQEPLATLPHFRGFPS